MDNNFNNFNNGQQNGFGQNNNYQQTNSFGQTQNGFGQTQQNNFGQTQNGYGQTQQNNFGQTQNGYGQTQQNNFGQTQNGFGTTPGGVQRRYDPNSYATSSSQTTTNSNNSFNNQYAGMTPSDLRQQMHSNSFVNRASSFANNGTVGGLSGAAGEDNIVMGILGGLGGAVLGIIVWLLIAKLGYMSWIGGFAISAGAFYGYLMLGKGFSKSGVLIVSVIIIISVWVAVRIAYTSFIADAYNASFGTVWSNFSMYMRRTITDKGMALTTAYKIDMGVGYLLTGLGAFSVLKKFKG